MSVASAVHVPLIDRRVDGYRGRQHTLLSKQFSTWSITSHFWLRPTPECDVESYLARFRD
jgi:hypothetical protein